MNTKLIGRWGESLAAEYLRKKGYNIVGAGYRTRFGEIDLIAENKKFLVFVEVKTRKDDSFAPAREFVTAKKQSRIIACAKLYLEYERSDDKKQPRFDVIEVYAPDGVETAAPKINHIENAFTES